MNKIILLFLSAYLLVFCSCKKSSSAPSIVGTWAMTNVSGYSVSDGSSNSVDTTAYSYNSGTNLITVIIHSYDALTNPPTSQDDTGTFQISTEIWTFNTDGTYSINESYVQKFNNTSKPMADVSTGIWEYLSNTQANTSFILTGAIPNLLSFNNNGVYAIQTLNSTTMVLTQTSDQTGSSGSVSSTNFTITFMKQ